MQKKKIIAVDGKKENSVNKVYSSKVNKISNNSTINLDTQVKTVRSKVSRRKFSKSDRVRIIQAYDSCNSVAERGAFLRQEGLYRASIAKWRLQLSQKDSKRANSKSYKSTLLHNQVLRENTTLKKKLAQAEAIIELQKKVSELLSAHVLNPEMSEE